MLSCSLLDTTMDVWQLVADADGMVPEVSSGEGSEADSASTKFSWEAHISFPALLQLCLAAVLEARKPQVPEKRRDDGMRTTSYKLLSCSSDPLMCSGPGRLRRRRSSDWTRSESCLSFAKSPSSAGAPRQSYDRGLLFSCCGVAL